MPIYAYPWAIHYRKSVFKANGYTIPKTWDQLIALSKKMKADGLTPIAFTDKDGWPAMGTFDILNMRLNGYDFHIRLMAGKARWDGPQVKRVFNTWRELLPYNSSGALGLTWQEGAQQLLNKEAGMYLLGTFVGQQFTAAADRADLDFFAYPAVNPKWGQDSIDAPIDGFLMSKKAKNTKEAKQLLSYLGTAAAENIYLASDPNNVGANKNANKSALQRDPEEVGAPDRAVEAHRPVPRSRHAARLRVDRDDPGAAAVPQQAGRREQPRQQHPEAEGGDLRDLRRSLTARDGDRGRPDAGDGRRAAQGARRPALFA